MDDHSAGSVPANWPTCALRRVRHLGGPSVLLTHLMTWWDALRQRRALPWVTGWIALFAVGIALGWILVEHMVDDHRKAGAALVEAKAQARVKSYGRQMDDLIRRLDSVGQMFVVEWARQPKAIDFEHILAGIYPQGKPLYVAVLDAHGQVTSSSFPPRAANAGDTRFFTYHREHCCDGWLVTPVEYSQLVGGDVLHMSRALSDASGRFAGVLMFALTPDLLTAFEDDSEIGPRDFVNVRLADGPVLTSKLGQGPGPQICYRNAPKFPSAQGVRLEPGAAFHDGRARFVAWRRHVSMPLIAVASITAADALADVEGEVRIYRIAGAFITVVLLLFCAAGVALAGNLAVRRIAEEEIRKVYRTATDAANEGFYMLRPLYDSSGNVTDMQFEDVNERGGVLLGRDRFALLGKPAGVVLAPVVWNDLIAFVRRALQHQRVEDEYRVVAASGLPSQWLYRHAVAIGQGVALTLRDISELKAHQEELVELAHRDNLTGLPNRLWFHRFMPSALQRAARSHKPLALMFIDLDDFKPVNDTLGHDVGDRVLREVARQLRNALRGSDQLVRLGGDEFLVIIENIDNDADIDGLGRKLIDAVEREFRPNDNALSKISASIGISLFPNDGESAEDLLKHADIAMYQAKARGRGQTCRYQPEFSSALAERVSSEQALRQAVEHDDLVVHFQPKLRLDTGRVSGAEALVRWKDPERGLLMPPCFIGLAEDVGLIVPIGEWVIRRVLVQMARWRDAGLPPLPVAINVSPEQLRRSDVAGYLQQQLTLHALSPALIEIEITESAMVEQTPAVQRQLRQLRALGVRLVIDDFGKGYSSLAQLQRLDVDAIKLDRELVKPLRPASNAEALCRAIIWMASALDLEIVAEGVETAEQARVLTDAGCNEIQGYVFSEPVPADDFERLLRLPQSGAPGWLARPGPAALADMNA